MSTFTGDITKLVAAPMLQDSFVDKDGTPMSAGTITCYHDNSRTTLKNWYYQSGTPGNYTYITLPNPLTLSAAGTICDINGVDTIPFFYPWSETDELVHDPYYITIVNHAITNQITRANFPFEGGEGGGGGTVDAFNNLVLNGSFWRNIQPNTLNVIPYVAFTYSSTNMPVPPGGTLPSVIVAPGNHDGFRMPDIEFQKSNFSGTDSVTFTPFPAGTTLPIPVPSTISGEYYLSHTSGVSVGVTQKCYQFPIQLHVNALANVPFTFTIQAQNDPIGGSTALGANVISIFILQDTGTGGTPSPSMVSPVPIAQFTLTSSWKTYSVSSEFPSAAGLTLGAGADDGLYLQVQMPLNLAGQINFTKPCIYLNSTGAFPTNDFQTYDEVDSIINSPRTGDIRTSINSFYYYGWVPMNDGTIGTAASNATARANADAWPLYNLIWGLNLIINNTEVIMPMFTSAGAPVARGASSYADFAANKQITLTKMMGHVMLGTVPVSALLPVTANGGYKSVVTAADSAPPGHMVITIAAGSLAPSLGGFTGFTVTFTNTGGALPPGITGGQVYYGALNSATSFVIALTFANMLAGTFIAFGGTGSGTTTANMLVTTTYEGEYSHVLKLGEMVNHTHNPLTGVGFLDEDGALNLAFGASTSAISAGTTGLITNYPVIGQTPLNITQPGTFYNMFIKL